MSVVMKIIGLADGRPTTVDGLYLANCEFDALNGRGLVTGTPTKASAMLFADAAEGLEFWRKASTTRPTRPDGMPNRPLTSYTVIFEKVESR
jgi:hypothetical protein